MRTLVIVEHHRQTLHQSTRSLLTAAQQLGYPVDCLVFGQDAKEIAQQCAALPGVAEVVQIESPKEYEFVAENASKAVLSVAKHYSHILVASTSFGKDLLPRVAATLDVGQISDIMAVVNSGRYVRPTYAGNARITVESTEPVQVMTVRYTAFESVSGLQNPVAPIRLVKFMKDWLSRSAKRIGAHQPETKRPSLAQARVVVSGGRGLQNRENFDLIEALADCFTAAVGATRAAVDAGYVANECQVGQTGQIVAPQLYIAIGISGAIQHLAGMKESQIIVAINKDPDAPIFQVADYGLVADALTVLPELITALQEHHNKM